MSTSVDMRADTASPVAKRGPTRWGTLAAGLYGVPATAALMAWFLLGDRWWTQALNFTTFWWLAPSLVLVVVAGGLRWWRATAFLAVPALAFVWSYGGLYVGTPPADRGDLRVVTYNTYIRAPDLSHVVSLVRDEDPDVLLVQEVLPARARELERVLGAEFPHTWFGEPRRVGGVGLLSRHPIVEVRPIDVVTPTARPTAVVVLDVPGGLIQVVPVHLTSPCPRCGASVMERQAFEASTRRGEIDAILGTLDPDLPAVVGGDFNSTRRSDPYRALAAAGFRDPQIEAGAGPGFTWPDGSGPFVRIDWVLARDLVPAGAHVDPPRASDHRPVIVDLVFPGGPAS